MPVLVDVVRHGLMAEAKTDFPFVQHAFNLGLMYLASMLEDQCGRGTPAAMLAGQCGQLFREARDRFGVSSSDERRGS